MRKNSSSNVHLLTFIAVLMGLAATVDVAGNASRAVSNQQATAEAFIQSAGL